jgi:hypothetical protein
MSAYAVLTTIADDQGWNTDTQLGLLLEYIDNQGSLDAFEDFLREHECATCGEG